LSLRVYAWFACAMASLALLSACGETITPKVSSKLDMKRNAAGNVAITLTLTNERDMATVPLLVAVDAYEPGTPGAHKPEPVIHPAPFVLNRHESRTMTAEIKSPRAIVAELSVKESERGILLVAQTKTIDAAAPAAPAPEPAGQK
jgi:hypothetical protein